MMLRRCLLFVCAVLAAGVAQAATITDQINFTATSSSGGAPAVTGSFLLTFDPTVFNTDLTTGLTVQSLSHSFSSPVTSGYNLLSSGTLLIGGTLNTVGAVVAGTNDYQLEIDNFNSIGSPQFASFALTGQGSAATTVYTFGTVTAAAVSPEPSSIALLGSGLLGVIGAARKRGFRLRA